jgi:hypothetical protein
MQGKHCIKQVISVQLQVLISQITLMNSTSYQVCVTPNTWRQWWAHLNDTNLRGHLRSTNNSSKWPLWLKHSALQHASAAVQACCNHLQMRAFVMCSHTVTNYVLAVKHTIHLYICILALHHFVLHYAVALYTTVQCPLCIV